MNLLIEKAKQIFIKQNIQISDEQLSEYINYCAQQWLNTIRLTTIPQAYDNAISRECEKKSVKNNPSMIEYK